MGDKSPKSKEKARKQGAAEKNQKKAAAAAKVKLSSTEISKKTK